MYCKKCGNKLSKADKFCKECGTKVNEEVTTSEGIKIPESRSAAIASLVIGIISFIFGYIFIPLPIIGLIIGICQKGKHPEKTAGIILNVVSLIFSVLLWGLIIFLVAVDEPKNYESVEDHNGNSDVIVNDSDYDFDFNDIFE